MTGEPKASPQTDRIAKVLRYRVAVKLVAEGLLELAETGRISARLQEQLMVVTRGK